MGLHARIFMVTPNSQFRKRRAGEAMRPGLGDKIFHGFILLRPGNMKHKKPVVFYRKLTGSSYRLNTVGVIIDQ
jgi:hypothetical protein